MRSNIVRIAAFSGAPTGTLIVPTSSTVDLFAHELCGDAAAIRERHPAREVQLEITQGMEVSADPRLLRIALENLLSNAWKYTSRSPQARVAVGTQTGDSGPVYFVRDNGVGFDMKYADKLFVPFQRLHPESEFPGSGIGLVTVQRIVARHGGRIWADAKPDEGATFYFTILGQAVA